MDTDRCRQSWSCLPRHAAPGFVAACCVLGMCGAAKLSAAQVDPLSKARAELEASYTEKLVNLAAWCDENNLKSEAAATRAAVIERQPWMLYLVVLDDPKKEAPTSGGTKPAVEWGKRFGELRAAQADALFQLARQSIRGQRPSLAYELVLEALRANPDHEEARRLLGYTRFRGGWHTPFEIKRLRAGYVWHDRFGWLQQSSVARYEAGERFYSGRWITAAEEARARSNIRNGWRIETEHYTVTTNVSQEAGVDLGQRLERLYRAWQQAFATFSASPDQLVRMFEGRGQPRGSTVRHQAIYFRNREEYQAAVGSRLPVDIETTGLYLSDTRTAYFFPDQDEEGRPDHTSLYHEATHQLFAETRPLAPDAGRRANFWILEGIACYMESFELHDTFDTLGGTTSPRLEAARHRALVDGFYVPLGELVTLGMEALQHDPRIAMLYSQSAGLAHFLMHAHDGRYRDALIEYLVSIYVGEDRISTLAEVVGESYSDLDDDYRGFLKQLPSDAAAAAKPTAAAAQ
jgi:tetratricopeptide (TPR) repeat protein